MNEVLLTLLAEVQEIRARLWGNDFRSTEALDKAAEYLTEIETEQANPSEEPPVIGKRGK